MIQLRAVLTPPLPCFPDPFSLTCFHPFTPPQGSVELPLSGEGVLIELVQAPPDVIAAHPPKPSA